MENAKQTVISNENVVTKVKNIFGFYMTVWHKKVEKNVKMW